VGDISGKGLPAAFLMAVSLGSLQSIVDQASPAPQDVLTRLNQTLLPYNTTTNQNCALCYADLNNDTLHVANAGGVTPAIRRAAGATEWLDVAGLPLGVELSATSIYHEAVITIAPGDVVVFISDGVIEAASTGGEIFGFDRLIDAIATGPTATAEAMLTHLQHKVTTFLDQADPHDDITIAVLRVL
jgi:sigma-B regulation protein RsbU (phosphoserine phosphatase)